MCFRPAQAGKLFECPQCGKKIFAVNGILAKKCPFCGSETDKASDNTEKSDK